jgi:NAD(P)H-hydrate epimerase
VLAGAGGNGGGGMVAARRLAAAGAAVELRLGVDPGELGPVPAEQYGLLGEFGVAGAENGGADGGAEPELLIDALLGYSQRGPARGRIAELVRSTAGRRVLALDVPTGLELSSGEIHAPAIRAEATLTLALPKRGLGSIPARAAAGDLYLGDLSIPPTTYEELGISHPTPFGPGPVVRLTGSPPEVAPSGPAQ